MTDNDDLESRRAAAIKEGICCSISRLRDEYRMKPKPGTNPVKEVKSHIYGNYYYVYRVADCIPLRAKTKPTEKQIESGRRLACLAKLKSARGRYSLRAAELLDSDPVFLDTETTGLGDTAEAIEIGVTDKAGHVLLDVRLKPTVAIEEGAANVHGITAESLAGSPGWTQIADRLQRLLTGRKVVIFNKSFDTAILRQTARAHGDAAQWLNALDVHCAMYLAAKYFEVSNEWNRISLDSAVKKSGAEWQGRAHSATGDAATTAAMISALAAYSRDLKRGFDSGRL